MPHRFTQVDVFTGHALSGNPLAVVHGADGLDAATMQRIAAWTNLSETTFLLEPSDEAADYQVRIFTPAQELPFAGHPTLGSAHAWLAAGGEASHPDEVVQQCGVGRVRIRRHGGRLAFAAPPLRRSGPLSYAELALVCDVLRIDPGDVVDHAWIDNGPGWMGILLADAEAVGALRPGSAGGRDVKIGVAGPHDSGHHAALEVRAFFAVGGEFREDPVTGSLNASLAQWLLERGTVSAPYVASQGTALGRAGRIHVDVAGDDVWVGGEVVTVVRGTLEL